MNDAVTSAPPARFVEGSTMRHVVTMTATASVGLVAIFVVDLLNLFYISRLGEEELAAAIGYAGTLLFFMTSTGIGIAIAGTALVSRALGAGDRAAARRLAMASLVFMAVALTALALALLPFLDRALALLGAEGRTRDIARGFLEIVVPTSPILGLGMMYAGVIRSVGDARRAMYVTLVAGAVTAVLDPILIFGFDLGVTGAAIANAVSRVVLALVGFWGASRVHGLVAPLALAPVLAAFRPLAAIAVPAVLTNIATPIGNAVVTAAIAPFGDAAVAGWAVIGRLVPVAFGGIFALSGAVGPILGQNLGARRHDRVRRALRDSLVFTIAYTLGAWALLAIASEPIVAAFAMSGEGADLVRLFCVLIAGSFLFNGALFVANASFNNLGRPFLSTGFNWARATLGTLPFVWIGARYGGAAGVLWGQALGSAIFGAAAIWMAFRVAERLGTEPPPPAVPPLGPPAVNPLSSGKAALVE